MTTEDFKEYYKQNKVTGNYDKQREGNKYRIEKRKKELAIFLKLLDKKPKEKVLELGCSSGFLTEKLGKVTAIDTSKDMLEITRNKNPQAKVIEADMFELPFKSSSFDKVVTMRVWNHLNEFDLRKALRETKRVLKKGGILVFDMEEKNWLRRFIHFFYKRLFKITGFKIYQYNLDEIIRILNSEGFSPIQSNRLNHKIGGQVVWRVIKDGK